ncbi:hypothetical protein EDEG_03650 [Edhazardia aedis USNM 41457]|uniref:Uncharacterized protein n=1 Tax=Edhazardia aedis (strain USNM 41457) TaxID=1003232 RepID=J9D1Y8_EDHAE|nr:hypothetical protein EDEG_03650 [Edhazardia aedis USNM 41457]|eukprot:EJW01876.1 hypothetical protein EDEG_03650 [Edhazardia aedis USNM 41457]
MKTLQSIEKSINIMDKTYDANFGEWVKNPDNYRIISRNLKKWIDEYSTEQNIAVIKWIVNEWSLRYIIKFVTKLIINDIKFKYNNRKNVVSLSEMQYSKRIGILKGMIESWDVVFIEEFICCISKMFDKIDEERTFIKDILTNFNFPKCQELIDCFKCNDDCDNKQIIVFLEELLINEVVNFTTNK